METQEKHTVRIVSSRKDSQEMIGKSTNNPEFGYIRVESTEPAQIREGGWLNVASKSTLIKGRVKELEIWAKRNGYRLGSELPGKVVVMEQTTPFYEGQEPKRAGADGEILTFRGQPIYRNTVLTLDFTKQDQLIQHENIITTSPGQQGVKSNDVVMK
jgi:hypothetical protein